MKIISTYGAPFEQSVYQKTCDILRVILEDLIIAESDKDIAESDKKFAEILKRGKTDLEDVLKWIEAVQDASKKQMVYKLDTLKRIQSDLNNRTREPTSEDVIRELVSHETRMNKLMNKSLNRRKKYARKILEANEQVLEFKKMRMEVKIRIQEAREEDLKEEEDQKKVDEVKAQIRNVGKIREKLTGILEHFEAQSFYLEYLLEKLRLCLMILEHDLHDTQKRLLYWIKEANSGIMTISVLEKGHEQCDEILKLVGCIEKLEELGMRIPNVKQGFYLKRLLKSL